MSILALGSAFGAFVLEERPIGIIILIVYAIIVIIYREWFYNSIKYCISGSSDQERNEGINNDDFDYEM